MITSAASVFAPPVPQTIEELGIPYSLMTDLVLRRLLLEGFCSLVSLSQKLRVSVAVVDTVFRQLRQQQIIDVKGMLGNDYHITLTTAGKQLASDRFQIS